MSTVTRPAPIAGNGKTKPTLDGDSHRPGKRDSEAPRKADQHLATPTDLTQEGTSAIAVALNTLIADAFAAYVKTKNFHWHLASTHFRDYHLMFDEQADQIFETIDILAERVRKIGKTSIRSIGQIAALQTVRDNDSDFVSAQDMLKELMEDNRNYVASVRAAHKVCDDNEDVATASVLEVILDESERRVWFLFEALQSN